MAHAIGFGVACAAALLLTPGLARADDFAALDNAVMARLATSNAPGLTLAYVQGNGAIVERVYGVRSTETGDRVIPNTLFRIGSVVKMWTAAALLKEMESKGLSVHAPIGSFVSDLNPAIGRLTVHQLL